MFHPSRRRAEQTAYEYNIQATEDHEHDHGVVNLSAEKRRRPRGKRPNYKPTALKWPFIVAQILVLVIAMGLIIWAEKAMPDSDSTAIIDPLPSKGLPERSVKPEFGKHFRRDNTSGVVETATSQLDVQETTLTGGDGLITPGLGSTNGPADNVKTAVTDDTTLTSATDSMATTEPKDKGSPTPSATAPNGTGSITRSSETLTKTEAVSSFGTLTTSTGESSSDGARLSTSTSQRGKSAATDSSSVTESKESGSATDTDSSSSSEPTSVSTQSNRNVTIPEHTTTFNVTKSTVFTTSRTRSGNSTIPASTATEPSTTPSTVATDVPEETIVSSVTVFPTTSEVPATTSETVIQTYVPYLSTGQTVITSVATVIIQPPQTKAETEAPITFAPQTRVVGDDFVPFTQVATPPPQTVVSQIGGTVTTIGGVLVTLINTPPPQTQVTVPISYVITTNRGGLTSVVISTPPPTRVVATINGTPVTFDSTLPPTTYTTTFGGTETFAPTTYLTSLSGRLSTITTTPSPSTYLSTAPLSSTTFTSTSNAPSATISSPPAQTSLIISTKTFDLTRREYFTGTFLPPLLAVSLVIPIRIIDLNAKLYQPFNSLASPHGATGYEALTLQFTGLMGFITPAITLLQGHPVPFITTLMVLCASLMVPLAVEAISLKLHGHCSPLSSQGCAAALGVSPTSAHALLALTATVIILLLALLFFLRDWVTGLHANPWNLAGIASLARNPDVRIRGSGDASLRRSVVDKTYGLGYYDTPDGREEYGLLLADDSGRGLSGSNHDTGGVAGDTESEKLGFATFRDKFGRRKSARTLPFMTLRYPWRVVLLVYLLGLLVLIAYYDYTLVVQVKNPTVPHYTSFHLFFDSHSFGIRFLFASLGVVITFCWQAFFVVLTMLFGTAVATIVPFRSLSNHTQPAARSILVSRPTNAFSGIYLAAAKLRHPFFTATSLATVLSEFLPILLSNIPHKLTQVLGPTLVCTRVSMAFLAAMIAVLLWSFFIRWPPMPVDPRSVAGMMWYVCESRRMLDDFEGVSGMEGEERDRRVREMGRRYYYGELVGRMQAIPEC
ncbi:hypothetical protein GE09DRAFT_1165796 [Coniochaeta sp. 2T2.1]|nr:hypothetical protein GE09DRAFT_1165796 [Coniochaeta sp. 2T2.1]